MQLVEGMPTTQIPEAPDDDSPARNTRRPYSAEEVRLLAETMAKPEVNGNLAAAVALLGVEQPHTEWNYTRCYKLVQSNRYLKVFHPAKNPEGYVPDDADTLNRVTLLSPEEAKIAREMAGQEKRLSAGDWTTLGLSDAQANRMLSMERFARQPLKAMIATTHGSMMFCLGNLLQNFEETARRISSNTLPDEFDGEGNARAAIDVERDWHKILLEYSKEIRAIKSQTDQSNLLAAKVAQMEGSAGSGPGKKGKPSFGPMTVNAAAGSQVAIMGNKP